MRAHLVFGTRPEIIKIYPVYKTLRESGHDVTVYYTKQNFTPELSDDIFEEYIFDEDDFVDTTDIGADYVIVQGDTWSTMEGALIAGANDIRLAHIEAGIRSNDYRMVEEKIRILVDKYSDFHFVPTIAAEANIEKELGVVPFVVGNTIMDLMKNEMKSDPEYLTVTLHRPETVDNKETLIDTLSGIGLAAQHFDIPVKFFGHPRTFSKLEEFNLKMDIEIEPPAKRSRFLDILKRSRLVITDSGGVQEEAAILKVPCVTARKSTERPETVAANLNVIAGNRFEGVFEAAKKVVKDVESGNYDRLPLYGDGNTASRIVAILEEYL